MEVLKNSSFLLEFFHFLSADYSKRKENLSQTVNFYLLVDWQYIWVTAFSVHLISLQSLQLNLLHAELFCLELDLIIGVC